MQSRLSPVWGEQKSPNRSVGLLVSLSCRRGLTVAHLFILLFASIMTAVPTRLYENVQHVFPGGASNAVEPGAESFSPLTYNPYLPNAVPGYSYTWTHSTADPSASGFSVAFFSGEPTSSFSYKTTLRWTNIKAARTSLAIQFAQFIAIGTSAGKTGEGLFLVQRSFNWNSLTFVSPTTTAVGVTDAATASLLRDDIEWYFLYFCGTVGQRTHLFKIDSRSFSAGGLNPNEFQKSAFSFAGEDSIAEWLKIGDYFAFWSSKVTSLYLNLATGMNNLNPDATLSTPYATRYAVLDHSSPVGTLYTFYTVTADAKILQVLTLDLKNPVSTSVLTVSGTTDTNQAQEYFFSKPVHVRNTQHVAIITKTGSNYFLRLFDAANALAEVSASVFMPVDLGSDYREHTLEVHRSTESIKRARFVGQFGNTVRSFFLLGDVCTSRSSEICTACPSYFQLNVESAADNECQPKGFVPLVGGSSASIVPLCGVPGCPSCTASQPAVCSSCDYGAYALLDNLNAILGCYQQNYYIPAGYGLAPEYKLQMCYTPDCAECPQNYQTCTKCKSPNPVLKIYYGGVTDLCVNSNIAAGYGIDTSDSSGNTIRACTASRNCATCPSDFSSCATCGGSFPVLKITGSGDLGDCIAQSSLANYGTDTSRTNPTIRPCDSSLNCASCTADYTTCATCPSSKPFRVPVNGNKHGCFTATDIPDGFGKDLSQTDVAAACPAGCKKCLADHTQCTECLSSAFVKSDDVAPLDCYPTVNDIPAGFGPQATGSKLLAACDVAAIQGCSDCADVFNTCSACSGDLYLYTPPAGNAGCYGTGALAIPDGVGPDIQGNTKTLIPCLASANCKSCPIDHRYCATCNTNYYLFDPDTDNNLATSVPVCVLNTAIVPGYGVESDAAANTQARALKCFNTLCKLCQADYKKCTECLEGTTGAAHVSYALTSPEVSCWTYANNGINLPAVHGLDKTNDKLFVVRSCQPAAGSTCAACVENYQSCDTCDAAHYKRTVSSVGNCFAVGSFPDGFGPDTASNPKTLLACTSTNNCLKCVADYQFCSECSSTGYYIMKYVADGAGVKKEQCLQQASLPVTLWGLDPAVPNSIRPCVSTYGCATCDDDFAKCKTCPVNKIKQTLATSGHVQCVTETNIDYYGLVSGTGSSLMPCSVPSCKNCFDNYLSCTVCEAPSSFLKVVGGTSPNTCVAANNVVGYGLDPLSATTIRQCTSSLNCETCTTDHTTCTTCPSTKPFRVPVGDKHGCFALTEIPDGYGKDISNTGAQVVSTCASSCNKCQANHLQCTECASTAFVKSDDVAPLDCYPTVNDIPAGFGPQTTGSKTLVACASGQYCTTCTDVFDTCTTCASNLFFYTPSGGKAGCYGTGALAIPDGVGPDIQGNTKTLISCAAASSCKSCTADQRYCTTCNTNNYLYDTDADSNPATSTAVCVLNTAIVPGYGVESDAASGAQARALRCTNTLCKLCQADYKKCTECLEGTDPAPHVSYTLPTSDVSCWTYANNAANLPTTHGLDKTNTKLFVAKACAPSAGTSCAACIENYLSCDSCANTAHYKLVSGSVGNCFAAGSTPTGFGPDLASSNPKTAVACLATQNCEACANDHTKCSACASGLGFPILKYIQSGTQVVKDSCVASGATQNGYGPDATEANTLKPCLAVNKCVLCPADIKKCTTCPPGEFLLVESIDSTKCVTEANIPDGKGKETDAAAGTQASALACQIASCAKCLADYKTSCTECSGSLYLSALGVDLGSPKCVELANIPEGFRGTAARTTEACSTTNCAACTTAAATCSACKSTYFLHSPNGQCLQNTPSIDGYRFGSGVTEQCATGCKVCDAAVATCTECFPGQFINSATCYTTATIPDGFGVSSGDTSIAQLVSCGVSGCAKCAPNHSQCTKCTSGLVHFDDTTWSCESALPSGYGNDPSSNPPVKTIKCQKSNCDVCAIDYTRCSTCKTGTSTYLEEGLGACYTKTQFPTGFGLNTADSKVVACSTTGCDLCVDDHTVCTKCQNNNGFYMKGTNSCIKKEAFAAGEGVNPTTLLVEKCTDTNCLECRDDIGVCKSCSTTTGYYLLKTACISKAQIAAGQGISATNGTVENCASGNCADCFDDYSKCVKCTDSTVFTLSAGKCSQANKGPVVDAQAIRIKASSGLVTIPLGPDQSRVVDSVTGFDLLEGKSYTGTELGVSVTIDSTGIQLKFSSGVSIQKGRLRINRRASENNRLLSTGRMLLDASPIIIEDFVLLQSSWVASLTDALTVILSILRLPASLLLFWKYPWAAMAVDTTATQLTYLGLLDGDSLAYPRLIFEMVSALKILPFRFANPFLRWNEATTNCVPLDSYAALGYYCSWLDNYGENFIALLSLILLALAVHFALGYALRKLAAGSKSYRVISAIQQAYGGRFVMAKLDANHLEVVIFAIANYARGATGGKGVLSVLIGTVLLVILILGGLLKTKLLWDIYKPARLALSQTFYQDKLNPEMINLQQATSSTPKLKEVQTATTSSGVSTKVICTLMEWEGYVSQNRGKPTNTGTALYYVFQYSRTLVLAILTLNLADKTWVLLMLAIFVEVAYTAYLIKCSNFRVHIERYSQLALQLLTILYLLLKAISTSEKLSDTARFTSFSNVLAVVLLMIVVVPIFLIFCAAIDLFYPFMSLKEMSGAQAQQNREWGSPKVTEKVAAPQAGHESLEQFGIRDQQNPEEEFGLPIPNEVAHLHLQHAPVNLQFESRVEPKEGVVAVEPVYIGRDDGILAPPDDLSMSIPREESSPQNA